MGEPKPTASLSGLLLARKGAARPAMRRPNMMGNLGNMGVNQDDLGWNDMGYDVNPAPNAPMDYDHDAGYNSLAGAVPEVKPEVRLQQERIAEQLQVQAEAGFESLFGDEVANEIYQEAVQQEFVPEFIVPQVTPFPVAPVVQLVPAQVVESAPAPVAKVATTAPKVRAAKGSKEKAAFTLRLNAERHLKLRLACAVNNRSAQMIVTEALDAFLDAMPEIGQLVARVPAR
jgi:hypothetical protein